jgi:hypothetical protein
MVVPACRGELKVYNDVAIDIVGSSEEKWSGESRLRTYCARAWMAMDRLRAMTRIIGDHHNANIIILMDNN